MGGTQMQIMAQRRFLEVKKGLTGTEKGKGPRIRAAGNIQP